jgi:hypothetical protein
MDRFDLRGDRMDRFDLIEVTTWTIKSNLSMWPPLKSNLSMWSPRRLGHMFLTIPFNMFYYIALKYGNFLFETLDTFPLLKDS